MLTPRREPEQEFCWGDLAAFSPRLSTVEKMSLNGLCHLALGRCLGQCRLCPNASSSVRERRAFHLPPDVQGSERPLPDSLTRFKTLSYSFSGLAPVSSASSSPLTVPYGKVHRATSQSSGYQALFQPELALFPFLLSKEMLQCLHTVLNLAGQYSPVTGVASVQPTGL